MSSVGASKFHNPYIDHNSRLEEISSMSAQYLSNKRPENAAAWVGRNAHSGSCYVDNSYTDNSINIGNKGDTYVMGSVGGAAVGGKNDGKVAGVILGGALLVLGAGLTGYSYGEYKKAGKNLETIERIRSDLSAVQGEQANEIKRVAETAHTLFSQVKSDALFSLITKVALVASGVIGIVAAIAGSFELGLLAGLVVIIDLAVMFGKYMSDKSEDPITHAAEQVFDRLVELSDKDARPLNQKTYMYVPEGTELKYSKYRERQLQVLLPIARAQG